MHVESRELVANHNWLFETMHYIINTQTTGSIYFVEISAGQKHAKTVS